MRSIKDLKSKTAIHCRTQEEANAIGKLFSKNKVINLSHKWYDYKENTCLDNESQYCELSWYKRKKYTIYQASEFLEINYEIY